MAMVTESNGVRPDMAKQRRQKQKEHRVSGEGIVRAEEVVTSTSPCSVVRHQKLCVAIDIAAQRIYGWVFYFFQLTALLLRLWPNTSS
jgi:hypothetical protein